MILIMDVWPVSSTTSSSSSLFLSTFFLAVFLSMHAFNRTAWLAHGVWTACSLLLALAMRLEGGGELREWRD